MLPDAYASVLAVQSRDDFRTEVVRFAHTQGFSTVSALAVQEGPGSSEFFYVDNMPAAYADLSLDTKKVRDDPVMEHVRKQSIPLIWTQDTYTREGKGELWEEQAQFGYRTGVAMALHLPEGRHFAFGVERDQPLPVDRAEVTRIVAHLQLFAVMAQDVALRVLVPPVMAMERPALTPRELEALRWTMEGKTAWEVGAILGISERTAVLHVNNAMHKLKCVNKHQAVLKALRLGLIH